MANYVVFLNPSPSELSSDSSTEKGLDRARSIVVMCAAVHSKVLNRAAEGRRGAQTYWVQW